MKIRAWLAAPVAALSAGLIGGCVATNGGVATAGQGCDELDSSDVSSAKVDADVKIYMQASVDLRAVAARVKTAVKTACVNVATDLGAQDTWTALGDDDDSIANEHGTGACDAANARIQAIMESDAASRANFALVIAQGACHTDFQTQASCDQTCTTSGSCDPGTVETRCTPGELSVVCDDRCTANSYCEGNAQVEAQCKGQCEAECHGKCHGMWVGEDGKKHDGDHEDMDCNGKCAGSCEGTCTGRCKIDAEEGVACGANVRCKGGCTTSYTDPVCESVYTPPMCNVSTSCEDSCQAHVSATRTCDPPTVKLFADTSVSDDVAKLVATVNANLPPLVQVGIEEGKEIRDVAVRLQASGTKLLDRAGSLDGKSLACGTAATQVAAKAAGTVSVSVDAGANVSSTCQGHSS